MSKASISGIHHMEGPLQRTIQCSCGVVSRPHTMGSPPSAFTPEPAALTSSSALGRVSCASITVPEPGNTQVVSRVEGSLSLVVQAACQTVLLLGYVDLCRWTI